MLQTLEQHFSLSVTEALGGGVGYVLLIVAQRLS